MQHPPLPDVRDSDCHRRLTRLLRQRLAPARIAASGAAPWFSASFSGARHWFIWDSAQPVDADARAAMVDALAPLLDAAQWDMPGHLVADIAVMPPELGRDEGPSCALLRVEVLTVVV